MTASPQPWHAEARRLRATEPPTPYQRIAEAVEKSLTQVYRVLRPAYGERQRVGTQRWEDEVGKARRCERYRIDPQYRAARLRTGSESRARRRERQQHGANP